MGLFLENMLVKILVISVTSISLAATTDYCNAGKCGSQHTLCRFPQETPGEKCLSFSGSGISPGEVKQLLHVHNTWRDYVAAGSEVRTLGGALPAAANMGALTWDAELARAAQRWALQCTTTHDECRDTPSMPVGQSLAFSGNTKQLPANVTRLALMWYENEVESYDTQGSSALHFAVETSHLTQWLWANTYKLGCGYSGFQSGKMHNNFLVCNYGPRGNINGFDMYTAGEPCSRCPNGTTCGGDVHYPHLCSSDTGEVPVGLPNANVIWPAGEAVRPGAPAVGIMCCYILLRILIS